MHANVLYTNVDHAFCWIDLSVVQNMHNLQLSVAGEGLHSSSSAVLKKRQRESKRLMENPLTNETKGGTWLCAEFPKHSYLDDNLRRSLTWVEM